MPGEIRCSICHASVASRTVLEPTAMHVPAAHHQLCAMRRTPAAPFALYRGRADGSGLSLVSGASIFAPREQLPPVQC